jgi:succinylarginine dihydrolase
MTIYTVKVYMSHDIAVTTAEANIDGLVGPTHNYAGLSFGNVASEKHALTASNPRKAALEGVRKMKLLHDLGIPQLVMPPPPRPDFATLRALGYNGMGNVPDELLAQVFSASAMWAANAATVSPSKDTADGKVHFTPANLISKFHRAIEPPVTADYLKQIFKGEHFVHHDPLPAHAIYSDEGAANHMRLSMGHDGKSTEVFVYGGASKKYPARQSRQACEAIIRLHRLDPEHAVLLEQSAEAIDAGVFHNDVIAMSNERLFIYHERAYIRMDKKLSGFTHVIIKEKDLALKDAVATYFFNSQLVTLPDGGVTVIAPKECEENASARGCFDRLIAEGRIKEVHYLDVRESMRNGGGPACLRLRVVLTEEERKAVHSGAWLNESLAHALCRWIEKHYRDRLRPDDLRDRALAEESQRALAELSALIQITVGH